MRNDFGRRRRTVRRLRGGLVVLGLFAVMPGLWAWLAPQSFYDDFPGLGFAWISLEPPFNEHLVRDVGTFYLAFGVMFFAAAWKMVRTLTLVVLGGWLVFALPHFLFHLFAGGIFDDVERLTQILSLAAVVVLPGVLAFAAARSGR